MSYFLQTIFLRHRHKFFLARWTISIFPEQDSAGTSNLRLVLLPGNLHLPSRQRIWIFLNLATNIASIRMPVRITAKLVVQIHFAKLQETKLLGHAASRICRSSPRYSSGSRAFSVMQPKILFSAELSGLIWVQSVSG